MNRYLPPKVSVLAFVIGFGLLFAMCASAFTTTRADTPVQYHYATLITSTNPVLFAAVTGDKQTTDDLNAALKALDDATASAALDMFGSQGWELVDTITVNNGGIIEYIFKR